MSNDPADHYENPRAANAGWMAGALVILAVFTVGAFFWFRAHP